MARHEADREDLMREATALCQRAEFRFGAANEEVIAGYRRDGSLSIYFGADPCYHFDAQLRLRRAFIDGDLYRTQGTTLARLSRIHSQQAVELSRRDLTFEQLQRMLTDIAGRLKCLHTSLQSDARCVEVIPPETDLQASLIDSLEQLTSGPLTLAPAIRGKR